MTGTSSILLRPATRKDTAGILAIYAPFILHHTASFEIEVPTEPGMWGRIRSTMQRFPWLVADDGGAVCGYAYASRHRERAAYRWACEVSVYVADSHYGRGIAGRLYNALFGVLREQGYCTALAGIVLPNEASVRFHQKLGFEQIACYKRIGFKFGQWHDTTWWQIMLSETAEPHEPIPFSDIPPDKLKRTIEA